MSRPSCEEPVKGKKKSFFTLSLFEIAVFGMLGAMMYGTKVLMEMLPNIHLVGVFIVIETLVYRQKALYPIYIFVFLTGLTSGFASWWLPYLYIWAVLWAMAMLIPKNSEGKRLYIISAFVCALHGLLYGTLYAPAQALLFHLDLRAMLSWIVAGLPYDLIHALGNLAGSVLIPPLVMVLRRLNTTFAKAK